MGQNTWRRNGKEVSLYRSSQSCFIHLYMQPKGKTRTSIGQPRLLQACPLPWRQPQLCVLVLFKCLKALGHLYHWQFAISLFEISHKADPAISLCTGQRHHDLFLKEDSSCYTHFILKEVQFCEREQHNLSQLFLPLDLFPHFLYLICSQTPKSSLPPSCQRYLSNDSKLLWPWHRAIFITLQLR